MADIPVVDNPVVDNPVVGRPRTRAGDSRGGTDNRVVESVVGRASSVAGRAGVRSPGSFSGASAHRTILSMVWAFLKPLRLWSLGLWSLGLRSLGATCA